MDMTGERQSWISIGAMWIPDDTFTISTAESDSARLSYKALIKLGETGVPMPWRERAFQVNSACMGHQ